MDELIGEFVAETQDSLEKIDQDLVQFEKNPQEPGLLGQIFRLVHTVKGTCGFLGLSRLEHVAHAGENILSKLRDNQLEVTPEAISCILETIDVIRGILHGISQTGAEPSGDDSALIHRIGLVLQGKENSGAFEEPPPSEKPRDTTLGNPLGESIDDLFAVAPQALTSNLDTALPSFSSSAQGSPLPDAPVPQPQPPSLAAPSVQRPAPSPQSAPAPSPSPAAAPPAEMQYIRVNVQVLEELMTMASELVLTRNQLMQLLNNERHSVFKNSIQRLNHITSELQDNVMKTRMQPIQNAWAKFPRMLRDLSQELGKKILLEMEGGETELDRHLLEYIKDPLTHMIRNAADHAIELPAERIEHGKPPEGQVRLIARHEGGYILISLSDDGRGLPLEKIKNKALEKGVVSEQELDAMTPKQIQQLIFAPGFSTAEKVTSISGRGVGMDVVKSNIEKIGGSVDMYSVEGRGSTFTIKIPLTLAIVSSLVVESAGQRFVIPQINIKELVRISQKGSYQIEYLHGTPILRLRDKLLPLVTLQELFQLPSETEKKERFIIVVQVGDQSFGLIVDRVFDTQEIVVKPLSPLFRGLKVFSGCTILGDGSVIMILDLNGILAFKGEGFSLEPKSVLEEDRIAPLDPSQDSVTLLMLQAGDGAIKAVPLAMVTRLEEFDFKDVESTNGMSVIQYHNKLMPLVTINDHYPMPREGAHPVLVFSEQGHSVGVCVDQIYDIMEASLTLEIKGARQGIVGSCIIAGKTAEIIDTDYYLQKCYPEYFKAVHNDAEHAFGQGNESTGPVGTGKRILLVDDSAFFRNLLIPPLRQHGYTVIAAEDGLKALDMASKGLIVDAIVSDIEMPGLNGFDFALKARLPGHPWAELPIIALSTLATKEAFERGRECGFTDYIAKFDRDKLFDILQQNLEL